VWGQGGSKGKGTTKTRSDKALPLKVIPHSLASPYQPPSGVEIIVMRFVLTQALMCQTCELFLCPVNGPLSTEAVTSNQITFKNKTSIGYITKGHISVHGWFVNSGHCYSTSQFTVGSYLKVALKLGHFFALKLGHFSNVFYRSCYTLGPWSKLLILKLKLKLRRWNISWKIMVNIRLSTSIKYLKMLFYRILLCTVYQANWN